MKIGILGSGAIGAVLTQRLSEAGHEVKVANSRGPESIPADLLTWGARAVTADEVATGVNVLIASVPLSRTPQIAALVGEVPHDAVIIDTSNYYPERDGRMAVLDDGLAEGEWVAKEVGRATVKAWNAITAESLATKSTPAGAPSRIAIPVAGDRDDDLAVAQVLVDETGFDAYISGSLQESWRHQPGTPAYCTDLTLEEMPDALRSAERDRSPLRRDLAWAVISERTRGFTTKEPNFGEFLVRLNRALYL